MPDLSFFVILRLPIMSVRPKRQKLSEEEISDIFDESSDFSDFEDESDESESERSDELSSDDAMATFSDWSLSGKERVPFNFSGESSVKFTVTNKDNSLEFFEQFWDDAIFDYLVSQANNFAKQFIDENLLIVPKNSRALTWFDTSVNEIKVFVGLLILQSVNSKSQNSMYFSERESISTPFFPKICLAVALILFKNFFTSLRTHKLLSIVLSENWQKSSHLSIYSYLNLEKILFHINKYALMNHY